MFLVEFTYNDGFTWTRASGIVDYTRAAQIMKEQRAQQPTAVLRARQVWRKVG